MDEFEEALSIMIGTDEMSISVNQIKDIAQSLDLNKDGFIDFNEFLEAFRIVDPFGKDLRKSLRSVDSDFESLGNEESAPTTPSIKVTELKRRKISNLCDIDELEISEA